MRFILPLLAPERTMYSNWKTATNNHFSLTIGTWWINAFFPYLMLCYWFDICFNHCFYIFLTVFLATLFSCGSSSYYHALRWQKQRNEISELEMWTRSCKFESFAMSSTGNLMNFLICVAGAYHPVFGVCHCLIFVIPMAMLERFLYFHHKFELDVKIHKKYLKKVMLFHLVEISIVTIFNRKFRTKEEMYLILFSEILFIFVTSWWTASYFTVRDGGIKMLEKRNRGSYYETCDADSDDDDSSSEDVGTQVSENGPTCTKCRICLSSYDGNSKKKTPLTLHGCGHTICYGCAQKLWKKTYFKISCPFCRKNTMIHSVKQLTKNYGLLELIEELRNFIVLHMARYLDHFDYNEHKFLRAVQLVVPRIRTGSIRSVTNSHCKNENWKNKNRENSNSHIRTQKTHKRNRPPIKFVKRKLVTKPETEMRPKSYVFAKQ